MILTQIQDIYAVPYELRKPLFDKEVIPCLLLVIGMTKGQWRISTYKPQTKVHDLISSS